MTKKIFLLILISMFIGCQDKSNDKKVDFQPILDSLENDVQKNLDTGERMLHTSRKYRLESDSLLNVIYSETLKLRNINSDSLESSQEEFLSKRKKIEDSLWKQVDSIYEETGISPELERMTSYGYVGAINMERASELNKILKNSNRN
ncbi:hypothetical protein [Christiangramia sabulilitoris]|uniref:Uncharacterized protein n=1 Tax=Christiangramia sabulilitoris TaxID=2583991 RepID=A0A550I740_9FLAO|nr:hypothetical protein [Christiangramia sabulilitoris]TRO66795.1 hypothetical protein FGM01_02575 [Christiangramia sabulilitoris]